MLYFVATPIGNLDDISYRAVKTLSSCDVIACEDTRHAKILLDHYDIHVKTIAYHKFNENNSANGIISLLKEGKNVAVISDAGMPVISDPGNILTKKLTEENIPFTIIPGANAGLSALVLSGMDASQFAFFGFLSEKNKERQQCAADQHQHHAEKRRGGRHVGGRNPYPGLSFCVYREHDRGNP